MCSELIRLCWPCLLLYLSSLLSLLECLVRLLCCCPYRVRRRLVVLVVVATGIGCEPNAASDLTGIRRVRAQTIEVRLLLALALVEMVEGKDTLFGSQRRGVSERGRRHESACHRLRRLVGGCLLGVADASLTHARTRACEKDVADLMGEPASRSARRARHAKIVVHLRVDEEDTTRRGTGEFAEIHSSGGRQHRASASRHEDSRGNHDQCLSITLARGRHGRGGQIKVGIDRFEHSDCGQRTRQVVRRRGAARLRHGSRQ